MSPFIETFTGERFQPLEPTLETIFVEDIAHALANQCRFSGHTRVFYSVAEHAVRVSWLLGEWGEDEDTQFWGVNHDDSEAYLVDLPTPLKSHPTIGEGYRKAERVLMRLICRRFGMPEREPQVVRVADAVMLATEVRDLMPGRPEHWGSLMVKPHAMKIEPWSAKQAEEAFMSRFRQLDGQR